MNQSVYIYIAIGAGIGVIFGGKWIALGAGIGLALGSALQSKGSDDQEQ